MERSDGTQRAHLTVTMTVPLLTVLSIVRNFEERCFLVVSTFNLNGLSTASMRKCFYPPLLTHGKSLPPHLSPFVNDEEENYVPEYRKKIKDLQVAAGVVSDDEDTKEEENELNDEDKEAKRAKIMMPSKKRRNDYIMKKRKEKSDEVEKLKSKRRKTSKKK